MADNTVLNAGAGGDTISTDDIAGIKHQRVKVEWGAEGVATQVADATGERLPVKVGDALPAGSANIGDVDVVTVPAPLSTTGAGVEATALRVTVASDSTGLLSVDDNGGSLTVDGSVSITGAIPAGTNNIGDVDVLTVPAPLSTTGGGAEATALRVTVASDSTGVLSVDDNGGSLTVDAPTATPVNVQIGDGTRQATVRDTGASDSLNVAIVDAAGAQITSFGGGTQYVEDAAAAADPTGTALNLIRADSPGAITSTDGDNVAARGTNKGEVYVKHIDAIPVTDNGGTLTVDVGTALPAGTNNIGDVDVLTVPAPLSTTGGGTEAAALRVTVANDSTGVLSVDDNGGSLTVDVGAALPAGTNNIGDVDVLTVPAPLSTTGGGTEAAALRVTVASDSTGVLSVDDNGGSLTVDVGTALPAGTNNIGDVDILTIAAGSNLIADVGLQPRTSGGLTIHRSVDLDESEEEVKATAGQLYGYYVFNLSTGFRHIKFYNDTAANVVVGTTTPILTIPLPAGAGANMSFPQGIPFSVALCIAATTGVADADTGAPAVNDVVANVFYK